MKLGCQFQKQMLDYFQYLKHNSRSSTWMTTKKTILIYLPIFGIFPNKSQKNDCLIM